MPKKQTRRRQRIQHHHLLIRMETKTCPLYEDKDSAKDLVIQIIKDIHMKLLGEPHVYYVESPKYNEGLTAIAPIQTSHIAFHFWRNPDRKILKHKDSHCLLQLDLYTCGSLSLHSIRHILHHLTRFGPTHVNATLLNRNYSLTLERQLLWDATRSHSNWADWVDSITKM